MNHKEKQSITHYISIRFAAIILIMAAIMILFISYFSNKTVPKLTVRVFPPLTSIITPS